MVSGFNISGTKYIRIDIVTTGNRVVTMIASFTPSALRRITVVVLYLIEEFGKTLKLILKLAILIRGCLKSFRKSKFKLVA
ncbi:hypothetical protein NIES3585_43430 [Nodularia sp. NIES-3585]|nr:hypothetical protein NIES3585_43430 [Nodularia sp. NIES-3585]